MALGTVLRQRSVREMHVNTYGQTLSSVDAYRQGKNQTDTCNSIRGSLLKSALESLIFDSRKDTKIQSDY